MRIGIDCRLSGIENAGIGRYIEELVRGVTQSKQIEWVLFFQREGQLKWLEPKSNVKLVITPVRHYSILEQILMPRYFAKEKLDLLHVPHFNVPLLYQGALVVTIHDLLARSTRRKYDDTFSLGL